MSKIEKFTVIYYGYLRQAPSTIHSHLEHVYNPFPQTRCIFSTWSKLWEVPPLDHAHSDMAAEVRLFPRWLDDICLGFHVHQQDHGSIQSLISSLHIPEMNCFNQATWRVSSYCKSLQDAARLALEASGDDHFLFCRPDLRFEGDLQPHIPGPQDCASNCGIDWMPDGSRRIGQAQVKGVPGRGFLDQLYLMTRRATERMSTIYDSIPDMWNQRVEINYETLVGWHLKLGGLDWTSADLAPISLIRPRGVVDGRLRIVYPGGAGPTTEH